MRQRVDQAAFQEMAEKAEEAIEETISLTREVTQAYRDANEARKEALAAKEQAYKFGAELVRVRRGVTEACEKALEDIKSNQAGSLSPEDLRLSIIVHLQDILTAAGDEWPGNE